MYIGMNAHTNKESEMTEWKADRINDVSDVKAFFMYLTEKLGGSWHVDSDFGDYVDGEDKNTFTSEKVKTLNEVHVCNVYQVALETMKTPDFLKKFADELQAVDTSIIRAIASGELDVRAAARREMASRGLDTEGRWIGFEAAKKLWQVD